MGHNDFRWYVEPKDEHTNEVIARELAAIGEATDNTQMELVDSRTGRKFNAWQVSYSFLTKLRWAENLRFRVFAQERKGAPIRESKFGTVVKRTKEKLKIEEQIEAISDRKAV